MIIAMPCVEKKLCLHFGHCQEFAFVDVDSKTKKINSVNYEVPPPHEPGVLPRWLAEKGAQIVIAGGMGSRAQSLFNQHGVEVITGASPLSPEEIAGAYLDGTLQTGSNICSH